jgi:SAM-dependent methyltransferase
MKNNWEYIRCNLCGSKEYVILFPSTLSHKEALNSDHFRQSDPNTMTGQIVRCCDCGLIYNNPQEKEEVLEYIYSEVVDDDYLNERPWKRASFIENIKILEQFKNSGSILDVGCGHGFFLEQLNHSRWESYGIDLGVSAIKVAKKTDSEIYNTSIYKAPFENEKFDVITGFHILEHLPNPRKFFEKCYGLLKKGGLIYLEIPDIGSAPARMFKRRWWYIMRFHTFYFTYKTLNSMLKDTGYKPLYWYRPTKIWYLGYLLWKLQPQSSIIKFLYNIIKRTPLDKVSIKVNPHDLLGVIAQKT